jgi:hypothetical protein
MRNIPFSLQSLISKAFSAIGMSFNRTPLNIATIINALPDSFSDRTSKLSHSRFLRKQES